MIIRSIIFKTRHEFHELNELKTSGESNFLREVIVSPQEWCTLGKMNVAQQMHPDNVNLVLQLCGNSFNLRNPQNQ